MAEYCSWKPHGWLISELPPQSPVELVYNCLQGDMSEEAWVRAVYEHLEMRSRQPFKCAVCERNMRSFIDYLADGGRVAIERREGVCWYCKK